MQLLHRMALNGAQLDEIDPRIIIKEISGAAGKDTVNTVSSGSGDGTRITQKKRDSVEISVKFSINIHRNAVPEREAVLEAVNAWAWRGGWLTVNYKPDRRLYVDEIVLPGEGDMVKWLNEYTITFRARTIPYWMQEAAVSAVSAAGSSGSGSIQVAGSAKTQADAVLQNVSGALINYCTVVIGGQSMTFSDLGMGSGESLVADHIISGGKSLLRLRVGGRSAMALRTTGSANDFLITPGNNSFSFSAQRACRLTVSVRGRFA